MLQTCSLLLKVWFVEYAQKSQVAPKHWGQHIIRVLDNYWSLLVILLANQLMTQLALMRPWIPVGATTVNRAHLNWI